MNDNDAHSWPTNDPKPASTRTSMKTTDLQKLVAANMPELIKRLGLQAWDITIRFGPTPDPLWAMTIDRQSAYNKATITLDASKIRNENHGLKCLLHELIHIVLAPMDAFFDMTRDHHSRELDIAWNYALEQTIVVIEQGLARNLILPEISSGSYVVDADRAASRSWDALRYLPGEVNHIHQNPKAPVAPRNRGNREDIESAEFVDGELQVKYRDQE